MANFTNKKIIKNNLELFLMVFIGLGIILVWFLYPYLLQKADGPLPAEPQKVSISFKPKPEADNSEAKTKFQKIGQTYGSYGDSYGSLNTLFSGLAFAVLIISLFMQRQELRAQREELEAQRNEIRESNAIAEAQKEIAENQHKIISKQAEDAQKKYFSDQFYSLFAERNNLLSHMTVIIEGKELRGFQVIALYADKFREIRREYNVYEHDRQFFKDKWYSYTEHLYGAKTYQIQSYFKLYRLLFSMIYNSSALSDNEKNMYYQIIMNFIDVEEKFILMWLGCFYRSFKTLCNKHGLLKGLNTSNLENVALNFFDVSAFGTSKSWKETFENAEDIE
ncbi:hypothetical protein PA3_02450 [Acinetobacter pittii]|uniref:Phage abortive infection protein n=1 Tax=Acinetobacter pittii TaxID=48296 RepID=A0A4Y3J3K7_ACIPI|nr:hypothetical protein [Acinetobacter pittii]GEA66087.1 hypothetical protein PA3_02450 [Acinetobacter pittii]